MMDYAVPKRFAKGLGLFAAHDPIEAERDLSIPMFLRDTRPLFAKAARCASAMAVCAAVALAGPSQGRPPTITVTEQANLRFGKFAVIVAGERTVGIDGSVRDTGLISAGPAATGPATFKISYDRGNASSKSQTLELLVAVRSGEFAQGGIRANLRNITSDVPGARNITPGVPFVLQIKDCRTRVCTTSFKLGATMEIANTRGGGEVVIPTFVDVTVTEIAR